MAPRGEGEVLRIRDTEVSVKRVHVEGLQRTKTDIVVEQVKEVLRADTLQQVLFQSLKSAQRLEQLGIFKHVGIKLDTAKDSGGKTEGLEVTFVVQERGKVASSLAANAGTQSGDASLSLSARNLFGRAEQLRVVSATTLPHWGQTMQLQFSKPYYRDIQKKLLVAVGTTTTKHPFSGYQVHVTGSALELQLPSWLGRHSLAWGYDWRQVYGFDTSVPMSVREQAGHSLKSSLKHSVEVDERDDPFLPHSGYRAKATQEVAGLGGDVSFGKVEVQTEFFKELFDRWVLSVTLWGGIMKPYTQSPIPDRFLLGGPTSLRGFGMWGAGPREQGYSLGGEAYWASGLHLFTPLPLITNELLRRIRIHSFVTAGNLTRCHSLSQLSGLARNIRWSCGLGIHFRLGIAQIELNYALPIRAQPGDQLQPGLQFGIGLDML